MYVSIIHSFSKKTPPLFTHNFMMPFHTGLEYFKILITVEGSYNWVHILDEIITVFMPNTAQFLLQMRKHFKVTRSEIRWVGALTVFLPSLNRLCHLYMSARHTDGFPVAACNVSKVWTGVLFSATHILIIVRCSSTSNDVIFFDPLRYLGQFKNGFEQYR